ncbi:MAG: biopolymer transporter ExbD [Pirellulaceae bacterium]|nr:biopolymer transporter ExbD [Pirellulaceae bacterium]MDP7020033.1 biopolymer transporter ExbD [Pirellulaceae bacterium]
MKLTSRRIERNRKIELSMTSMIDVVFLLLIFFMVTSSFVQTERHLETGAQVRSKTSSASDLEPAIVEIVEVGGEYVFQLGGRDFTDQAELRKVLAQFDNKSDGAFVRVSDGAPFGLAAAAIQACKSAGFISVSYVPKSTE